MPSFTFVKVTEYLLLIHCIQNLKSSNAINDSVCLKFEVPVVMLPKYIDKTHSMLQVWPRELQNQLW